MAAPYQYLLGAGMLDLVGCDDYFNGKGTADAVGVKAIDATTLQMTLKAPKPTFTTIMSLWPTFPVRQDVIEKFGDKWTDPGNIVVNGPYTLTEFVAKDHVTLAPNPNWALDPKPQLQKLTVKFIDDQEVAFRAFQTGELDMTQVAATDIPTIQNDSTLKSEYLQIGSLRIWAVEMQMNNPVLKQLQRPPGPLPRHRPGRRWSRSSTTTPTCPPPTGWSRACPATRATTPSRASSATTRPPRSRRSPTPATPTARASRS